MRKPCIVEWRLKAAGHHFVTANAVPPNGWIGQKRVCTVNSFGPRLDPRVRECLANVLNEHRQPRLTNRRVYERGELLVPASVHEVAGKKQRLIGALTVNMSPTGTCLVHQTAGLAAGEYLIALQSSGGSSATFRSLLEWCRRCGDGWHASGWQFLAISRI